MKSHVTKKKGIQLNEAFGAVLILVLIAVLVIVSFIILGSLQGSFADISASVINESASINTTGYVLTNSTSCNFGNAAIISGFNSTGVLINAANYTIVNGTKVFNTTGQGGLNGGKISYSFTTDGASCIATADTITQFSTYPALVGLIGTIIFLGIIIGVLVAAFAFGGRKGA